MARKGGGFGFVMLLVVLAIVMLLVARSWERIGPSAQDVAGDSRPDDEQAQARDALADLPGLDEMRQATDDHAEQLAEIAKQESDD